MNIRLEKDSLVQRVLIAASGTSILIITQAEKISDSISIIFYFLSFQISPWPDLYLFRNSSAMLNCYYISTFLAKAYIPFNK